MLIVSTWLFSGYVNGTFLFENTISCDTRRSLVVTQFAHIVASLGVKLMASMSSPGTADKADCLLITICRTPIPTAPLE